MTIILNIVHCLW